MLAVMWAAISLAVSWPLVPQEFPFPSWFIPKLQHTGSNLWDRIEKGKWARFRDPKRFVANTPPVCGRQSHQCGLRAERGGTSSTALQRCFQATSGDIFRELFLKKKRSDF